MNFIDIIIIGVLLFAIYSGIRDGVVLQVGSIVAIFLGLYLASNFSEDVASIFGIKGQYRATWGFMIVMVASFIGMGIVGFVIRKFLKALGLGLFDSIFGAVLSVCKYALIMSFIFSSINAFNDTYKFMSREQLSKSTLYYPVSDLTNWAVPVWDWTQKKFDI